MKTIACIQARMGSTRLPEKVMADLNGATVIEQIYRRLKKSTRVDEIVIATSTNPENRVILDMAETKGLQCFAGSENDLVDRLHGMCVKYDAEALVRVTADCPIVDPTLVDQLVDVMAEGRFEYVTNILPPTFPDGLDLDIVAMPALRRLWDRTRGDAFASEWFNHDLRNNSEVYRTRRVTNTVDLSSLRWTLDYPEDLELIRAIYERLSPYGEVFSTFEVLRLLENEPALSEINAKYVRDAAYYAEIERLKTLQKQS